MVSKRSRAELRAKKHMRIRNRLSGTAERPRLSVFRSNNHMYAQIIDDTVGNTLVAASTVEKEVKAELEKTNDVEAAAYLGKVIAKRAIDKGITEVVFDRGAGLGKAVEIPEAIRKGKEDAIKNLITVAMDDNNSITHDFIGNYGSSSVLLKRAPEGTGIIAGGPARVVCELAGIKNIRTKSLGSNNKQNVVLSTIAGLSQLKTPEQVAANRGKSVDEIMA